MSQSVTSASCVHDTVNYVQRFLELPKGIVGGASSLKFTYRAWIVNTTLNIEFSVTSHLESRNYHIPHFVQQKSN